MKKILLCAFMLSLLTACTSYLYPDLESTKEYYVGKEYYSLNDKTKYRVHKKEDYGSFLWRHAYMLGTEKDGKVAYKVIDAYAMPGEDYNNPIYYLVSESKDRPESIFSIQLDSKKANKRTFPAGFADKAGLEKHKQQVAMAKEKELERIAEDERAAERRRAWDEELKAQEEERKAQEEARKNNRLIAIKKALPAECKYLDHIYEEERLDDYLTKNLYKMLEKDEKPKISCKTNSRGMDLIVYIKKTGEERKGMGFKTDGQYLFWKGFEASGEFYPCANKDQCITMMTMSGSFPALEFSMNLLGGLALFNFNFWN